MAKDGTARGGPRVGSGRKSKALADKVTEGKAKKAAILPEPVRLSSPADMPPVKAFMVAAQYDGTVLSADETYRDVYKWLKERGCESLVSLQMIEQYAMAVSRWIQCEEAISEYGFLSKHPTTGATIASPYVTMAQQYMKQSTQIWYQIYQVVKENCSVEYGGTPHDDLMEKLLCGRKIG